MNKIVVKWKKILIYARLFRMGPEYYRKSKATENTKTKREDRKQAAIC